jgi:hypothetical protein
MPWTIAPMPAYVRRAPRPLRAICHDGSPFVSIQCACHYQLHLHETQLDAIDASEIGTYCHQCNELLVFPVAQLRDAFTQMRKDGWIT